MLLFLQGPQKMLVLLSWLAETAQNQTKIYARIGLARVINNAKRLRVVAVESENSMD